MEKKTEWYCNVEVSMDDVSKIAPSYIASHLSIQSRMFDSEKKAHEYFDYMQKAITEASRKFDEK